MSMQAKQVARKNKKKKSAEAPRHVTRAVTHIRLAEANGGKLAALDALAPVYISITQQYVTLFCTEELPDKLHVPIYETELSERWHRCAIMQAAGIAKSWRSNRANALRDYEKRQVWYEERLALYKEQQKRGVLEEGEEEIQEPKAPEWHEWNIPALREWCLQANVNVVKLEPAEASLFDYWLKVSTLDKGNPLLVPVKLADYHKEALKEKKLNSSVSLNKRKGDWWLTVTYDEEIAVSTVPDANVVGIDVGIANFITTSTGKHYGSMHGKLKAKHKRDRAKRRRKAKLRACLERKGVKKLPSTSSRTGQKLIRQTKQEINRAVNECFNDSEHQGTQFTYEDLSVASMRFKARAMNAYLRASNLAHIPGQIKWNAEKRGVLATPVNCAYSSQECSRCHYTSRKNRPNQKTFFCQVCGFTTHADINGAVNVSRRKGDRALQGCRDRKAIKALLMKRHEWWKQEHGLSESQPTKRRRGKPSKDQNRSRTPRKTRISSKGHLSSFDLSIIAQKSA
jgi:Putative transposase DNA-binding domain